MKIWIHPILPEERNKQRSSEDERIILGNSDIGIRPLLKS
jgi:hypothetical protein